MHKEVPETEYTSDNLPAAFWDEYPEKKDDNPDLAAINAILEESTPDERAETYKATTPFLLSSASMLTATSRKIHGS